MPHSVLRVSLRASLSSRDSLFEPSHLRFVEDLDLAILLVLAAALVGADKEVNKFVDDISWRIIAGVRIRTAPKIGVIHILIIDIDDLFAVVRYG